jgi:hypothetical protein
MLKKGSTVLSIWCVVNFLLALIILCYVIVLKKDSPILQVASFSEAEIARLSARTIAALNCFTILYNSCSLVISVLTWPLIRHNLIAGQKSAFGMLVFVIGFVQVMAFIATSYIGYGRWQVNVFQSILYMMGISLAGYSIFIGGKNEKLKRNLAKDIYIGCRGGLSLLVSKLRNFPNFRSGGI